MINTAIHLSTMRLNTNTCSFLFLIIIIDINHIPISFLKTRLMISHQHHITEVVSKMNTLSSGCVLLHYRDLENYMDVLRRISQLEQSWKLKLKQVGLEG